MLYLQFARTEAITRYLAAIEAAREALEPYARLPEAYAVELRRHAQVESVHYSTRIEGNTLTLEQVESTLVGEPPTLASAQVQEAQNYRDALQYLQTFAGRTDAVITQETLLTLHYLVSRALPGAYGAGRFRTDQNYVVDRVRDRRVFLPPPPDQVLGLLTELVTWLREANHVPPAVRAALAHLNLVAIHPFSDGNGRTARLLESLVLYLGGYRSQELVSLEAYFGRDTAGYYRALAASLGSAFRPPSDVTPWVEYALEAHAVQAESALHYQQRFTHLFRALEGALLSEGVSAHQVAGLLWACRHAALSNRVYRELSGRSPQAAASDLAALVTKGLMTRRGAGRTTAYLPAEGPLAVYHQALAELDAP